MPDVTAFEHNSSVGWSKEAVHKELNRRHGLQFVAYDDCVNTAIGWCCGFRVGEEAELLRIAVAIDKRRCGVASALLVQFEKVCAEEEVSSIFLEVASRNTSALRLYDKFGYSQVGIRRGYYNNPLDDALVMNKMFSR